MKKHILLLALLTCASACNDDFLEKLPQTSISPEAFFNNEDDLALYVNGLLSMPDMFGVYLNDQSTDNAATTAAVEMKILMTGSPSSQTVTTGWDWGRLRNINYFLDNYNRVNATADVKAHYAYLQEGGKFDVARAGWSADYADPENFLNLMVSTNKAFNYGHWENAKYDELMKASYNEADPAKRMKLLQDAEALMLADYPIAPMMNYASLWLINKKVKGFNQNLVNEHLTKYLSIE